MLNLSAFDSLRGLPVVAQYGLQSVGYYFLVALFFLIPSALASSELATGWPKDCGVNTWVTEAFGPRWGFFAVWMQWIHNATWFPTVLSFIAATIAYLFNPEMANNKVFVIAVILLGFWGFTLLNYFGIKTSAWVSTVCVVAGTLVPGVLLIGLAIHWVWSGHPVETSFSLKGLIPNVSGINELAFLGAMILSFGGLELSAVHVKEVHNPQKNFPRAILIASVTALVLYSCVALSIAVMIPRSEISLVAGIMETFHRFFRDLGVSWVLIPVGVMVILGSIAELNSWIIAPARAVLATSKQGRLPLFFQKENRYGMPTNILLFQALIVTGISFVFFCMPSVSSGFWILSAISVQLYLLMYMLLFASVIRLRHTQPQVKRSYRIPFGLVGVWIVGLFGLCSSIFTFLITFLTPSQILVGNLEFYEIFLVGGVVIMCAIPHFVYRSHPAK